jgi:dTDP-4-dehydrorhamnose reductase
VKKILLIGKNGQLGYELERTLAAAGEVIALNSSQLNLTDTQLLRSTLRNIAPDIIINAAAYTAVDQAEAEPDLAMAINGIAPGVMAEEAQRLDALLIHYSTDYVFDGSKIGAYTEQDTPNPLSVYGKTKLHGEQAIQNSDCRHLIFRTSWVYGKRGKNFMLTMLRLAKQGTQLKIVNDQIGAPTSSSQLAQATAQVLQSAVLETDELDKRSGLYHLSAAGQTSWYGFALAIFKQAIRAGQLSDFPEVIPIASADYPTAARRPMNSVLSNQKISGTFGITLPDWESALAQVLPEQPA